MIDLTDYGRVKTLKSNLEYALKTEAGKEVMMFLEELCGWYDFKSTDPNQILIAHGKRQVLATIKTLLNLSPEQIVALTEGELNG